MTHFRDDVIDFLRSSLGLSKPEELVLCIPRKEVILKTVTLPTTHPAEIRDMVRLQVPRLTPLAAEDVIVDFQFLEKKPEGSSVVQVFIARKEDIEAYLKPLFEAGVYPDRLAVESIPETSQSINLLPPDEQKRKARARMRKDGAGVAFCAFVFLSALGILFWVQYHAAEKTLSALTQAERSLWPQTAELRRMDKRLSVLRHRMDEKGSLLSVLSELSRLVPKSISIRSVHFEGGQPLVLEGNAMALSEAVRLVETLQQSPMFSSVELRSSTLERSHNQDLIHFSIEGRLHA